MLDFIFLDIPLIPLELDRQGHSVRVSPATCSVKHYNSKLRSIQSTKRGIGN